MPVLPVLDTETLAEANRQAIKSRLNKTLTSNAIKKLDPDGKHVIYSNFLHGDDCVRCFVLLKMEEREEPVVGMIDMPIPFFNDLTRQYVIEQ